MARLSSSSVQQEIHKQRETGVTVTNLEELTKSASTTFSQSAANPLDWPSGEFLLACLEQQEVIDLAHHDHHHQQQHDVDKNSGESNGELDSSSQEREDLVRDPQFWQASARRALLHKYGHLASSVNYDDVGMPTSRNVKNAQELETIQTLWKQVVESALSSNDDNNDDLIEFVQSQCQQSNNRNLQWSGMHCQPGTQFQLHAHPNLELVYCSQGALHEIRMMGDPLTRHFEREEEDQNNHHHQQQQQQPNQQQCGVQGPSLTTLRRSWRFATLPAGRWLVNEVGSIHKSFTSTAGTGCQLLAMWGGSHANIRHPPDSVNIQEAVDSTDRKAGASPPASGCHWLYSY